MQCSGLGAFSYSSTQQTMSGKHGGKIELFRAYYPEAAAKAYPVRKVKAKRCKIRQAVHLKNFGLDF